MVNKTVSELIMEYFYAHPNEDLEHGPVVDWVTEQWLKPMIKNYNPDVLSCLANFSSDEVFTPSNIANQMLDLLPASFWRDPDATFLDPACKSGIFLREIAKRLLKELEERIHRFHYSGFD